MRPYLAKILLLLSLLSGFFSSAQGQQDPLWSMCMFNRMALNPGFTGYQGAPNVTFAGRTQWVGVDGAPNTVSLAGSIPSDRLHGAVGATIIGDVIGPFSGTDLKLNYAYKLQLKNEASLQIGIAGGVIFKSLDGTNWHPPDNSNTDAALYYAVKSQIVPDVNLGISYYAPDDRFYAGISFTHLTDPKLTSFTKTQSIKQGTTQLDRMIGLTAGYRFDFGNNLSLQPSTFIRIQGSQKQIDLNANLLIDPIVIGISYRLQDAFVAILGFQASERIFVAYSYDYTTSHLSAASSGSHEIVVSYTLPRFFKLHPKDEKTYEKKSFR